MTDGEPPETPPPGRRARSTERDVVLAAVAIVAILALLFVFASAVGRSGPASSDAASTSTSASASLVGVASPSPRPSGSDSLPSATLGAASGTPATSPSPAQEGPDPVLVGAGDIAACGLTDDSKTADLIAGIEGTVFTAGDNAYPDGTKRQFDECYAPTWGRFLDRTRPTPGNHDHNTRDLAGYLEYFGAAAAPDGKPWYSFDLGTWHVVMLDSNCDRVGGCGHDSEQGGWLVADLAASSATCTMAIWHHPRWSSGEHGNDKATEPFWDALYGAGADVVVNGHDHDYERFAPQDPAGHEDQVRGMREFVVGTGGASLRGFGSQAANSEVRMSDTHGVIEFTLHTTGYDWRFIPTEAKGADAGSASCH